ncbi:MAG: hypothetical protein LBD53_04015, partial [Tannerella sp.]|nr:hypothetical protein [Tannerella sp.]
MTANCSKGNDEPDNLSDEPILFDNNSQIGNGDQEFEIKGDYTLDKGTYKLKGWVYVTNGSTLTISAGTIIKGDKDTKAALIVEPGGKLIAQGTATEPIVFTSAQAKGNRKPGDWGGLIICGRAKNNKTAMLIEGGPRTTHGGTDDNDNSGILSYVRVEFAGYPLQVDQEINGITFGSVGKNTKIDHLQVSYSNDDSYEWFGGTVNAKYLIAYHGWDDDFDTDNGFSGKLQFLLGVRNPKIADTSLSNGFESDNNSDGTTGTPLTSCMFSNVTLVGPIGQADDFANTTEYINGGNYNPQNGSKTGTYQSSMQIRRNSNLSCFNSVAMGFPVGIMIDNQKGNSQGAATNGTLKVKNLYLAQVTIVGSDVNKSWKDLYSTDGTNMTQDKESFSHTWFKSQQGNEVLNTIAELKLKQPNSLAANPNWGPAAGSPLVGKSGLFADLTGFEVVDYIGAFRSDADADNWTKGWTNFDPQNADY